MKVILENPPEGFQKEAEFRPVREDEHYLSVWNEVVQGDVDDCPQYCIVLTPVREIKVNGWKFPKGAAVTIPQHHLATLVDKHFDLIYEAQQNVRKD